MDVARRARSSLALVLAVALVARLAVVLWAHGRFPASEDGHYYDVLARRLASGDGYTWLWPDGAVTYAAHYPVGYPGMLALAYASFGASAGVAMTLNAIVGAAAAVAAYVLVDGPGVARWRPMAAGLVVALHPALVPYTAAVMTEGVTAALLVIAAALAARARLSDGPWRWIAGLGVTMAIATLVRPQSLLLAPVLGALAAPVDLAGRGRLVRAVAATGIALACIAPWTARNCARMHRCAMVSVNGGWNLLIGAQSRSGAWEPVAVPAECATTWDEAGKDACFERVARRDIAEAPLAWLGRAPSKVAMTLDYFGAAPWYLHAVDPEAFGDDAKKDLGAVETVTCRLLLLGSLWTVAWMRGPRRYARWIVAALGALASLWIPGWVGYVAVLVATALLGKRSLASAPILVPATSAIIAATVVVHAAFFGAGRYGLVVVPFVAALAFARAGRDPGASGSIPTGA